MRKKAQTISWALAAGLALATGPDAGAAQSVLNPGSTERRDGGFVEDTGASERVDYAGRLRMLTQRVAAMMCYNFADLNGVDARTGLLVTAFEIDLILDALEFGNEDLGIVGAETNPRILSRIRDVRGVWEPMRTNIEITIDFGFPWSVGYIYLQSAPLLEASVWLATDISGAYADPVALLQEDAMRISIAGRQRMLAQRISKAYCYTRSDIQADLAFEELQETTELWSVSAEALRFGMPQAGINQTDNPVILSALDEVLDDWIGITERIQVIQTPGGLEDDDATRFITSIDLLTVEMNNIVRLFSQASKLDL